jgi:hypothetical protein
MDTPITHFADRHRCQFGVDIIEQPGRLRVEPRVFPMWVVVAWMVFIHLVIIGIIIGFQLWRDNPAFFALFFGTMALEFPTLIGLFFAMNRAELAKGPLLEIQELERVVVLFRDRRTIKFDDVEAVFVLVGWYGATGWERVAEMTLIVRDGGGGFEWFPVILHNQIGTVEGLADRLAGSTGKPLRRSSIPWAERQRRSV